jgi:ligand-binding sensor domain-containing protein
VLWAGTDQGVFRKQGSTFTRVDATGAIPAMNVYTIYESSNNDLYVAGSGLLVINSAGLRYFQSEESRADAMVGAVQNTRDGTRIQHLSHSGRSTCAQYPSRQRAAPAPQNALIST